MSCLCLFCERLKNFMRENRSLAAAIISGLASLFAAILTDCSDKAEPISWLFLISSLFLFISALVSMFSLFHLLAKGFSVLPAPKTLKAIRKAILEILSYMGMSVLCAIINIGGCAEGFAHIFVAIQAFCSGMLLYVVYDCASAGFRYAKKYYEIITGE